MSELYKEGLQRDQFLPFINIIEKNSIQKELLLDDDYRIQKKDKNQKIFYPVNEKNLFNINQNFRVLTRNLKKEEKIVNTKGRKLR